MRKNGESSDSKLGKQEVSGKPDTKEHPYISLSAGSISEGDLHGGNLGKVMAVCMYRDRKARGRFLAAVDKEKGKHNSLSAHYKATYGYPLSMEFEEWAEVSKAYSKFQFGIPDIWSFDTGLSRYGNKPFTTTAQKVINDWAEVMVLFTGLELFGRDGSGDSCFLSVLPTPLETAEVYYFNHENGEIENCLAHSIAGLVADLWGTRSSDDDNCDDAGAVSGKVLTGFENKAENLLKGRPFYHDPEILFRRAHWLIGHPLGQPTWQYAQKMEHAPKFCDWEEELPLLSTEPVLANYWLLAHYFLDNTEACLETVRKAKLAPGSITRELAGLIEKLIHQPEKARLGALKPEDLRKLKQETRKNCSMEQLAPQLRASLASERGDDAIRKLSDAELQQRVNDGTDLWELMSEYPDDVASHDKILKHIAKQERSLSRVIDQYFSERTSDYFNEWPYDLKDSHRRLSLPVSAAFRSGLKFDADHGKAYAGLTRTLGMLDDDNAMQAYREALSRLSPDDPRLEYVIAQLASSKHPESRDVMRVGARKFFDHFDATAKSMQRTEAEGPTLNNIFYEHSHLRSALEYALSWSDSESVKLAGKVLGYTSNLRVLGKAIGYALRVAGDHNLQEVKGYAEMYCTATASLDNEFLDQDGCFNVSEAAIAYAKLSPSEARPVLGKLFNKSYTSRFRMLDIRASVLAGLLILDPSDPEYLKWAERILGNRSGEFRVYGVLRGIEEGKVREAASSARYHVYADPEPMVDYTPLIIEEAARQAIESALGETLPEFDSSNKFASGLANELLADAITQPEKYLTDHVLRKIADKRYQHPSILSRASHYLLDSLRYTRDEQRYAGQEHRWDAIRAMIVQGVDSLEDFAKVLELPEVSPSWYTNILYSMRIVEPEAEVIAWLLNATPKLLNAELDSPSPRFMPWLDYLSAFAFVGSGQDAQRHIEKAVEWRYRYVPHDSKYPGWIELEPTVVRLPKIYGQFGKLSLPVLQVISKRIEACYDAVEHVEAGLRIAEGKAPAALVPTALTGEVTMVQKIKDDDSDSPEYVLSFNREGKQLKIRCLTNRLYFQNMVPGQRLESTKVLSFDSDEEALAKAELLAHAFHVLGYKPKSGKTKSKRS